MGGGGKEVVSMILYHGSQSEFVAPEYGRGSPHHDFGAGFYLSDSAELAGEWSVCRPGSFDGWVHAFEIDFDGLRVFDFREAGALAWIAELMKHRPADESAAYRRRAPLFIERFGVDVDSFDVIAGWRADASYFYIAKAFVRDEVDASAIGDLLRLGDYGMQYALKSERAFGRVKAREDLKRSVSFGEGHGRYERRDAAARERMRTLIADPSFNKLERLFSDLVRGA